MAEADHPTVLVVEDEAPLIEIYARWLGERFEVRTAQNGESALEQLDEDVDVVLLDRLMPGMSGDEVLAAIEERGFSPRVAMVTAVEPDFDIITMGFDDYLTKPVDREELVETVDRLLSRSSFAGLEQEYYACVEKRAALESAKSVEQLETSEEYVELTERIDELRGRLDDALPEMGSGDFVAMVRDIERGADDGADEGSGDSGEGEEER
jgi:DNA-binding response OmpR family regulator